MVTNSLPWLFYAYHLVPPDADARCHVQHVIKDRTLPTPSDPIVLLTSRFLASVCLVVACVCGLHVVFALLAFSAASTRGAATTAAAMEATSAAAMAVTAAMTAGATAADMGELNGGAGSWQVCWHTFGGLWLCPHSAAGCYQQGLSVCVPKQQSVNSSVPQLLRTTYQGVQQQ